MKLLTENNMGLLFKADSREGPQLAYMLLNQGGVENPAKYKVEFCLCTLLSNSLKAILRFGKDSVDQVQRHILAGSRLQG